jgi:hypothetical protein
MADCRVVGMMEMNDEKGGDAKVRYSLCVILYFFLIGCLLAYCCVVSFLFLCRTLAVLQVLRQHIRCFCFFEQILAVIDSDPRSAEIRVRVFLLL